MDSARHVGERRNTSHVANLTVEISVTVLWPEGVPFDIEECKRIAASAASQQWETDVGPTGKIVWAKCSADCREEDVEVDEAYPVGEE